MNPEKTRSEYRAFVVMERVLKSQFVNDSSGGFVRYVLSDLRTPDAVAPTLDVAVAHAKRRTKEFLIQFLRGDNCFDVAWFEFLSEQHSNQVSRLVHKLHEEVKTRLYVPPEVYEDNGLPDLIELVWSSFFSVHAVEQISG